MSLENAVYLTGKLSRWGAIKYTPKGVPVREAVLAVKQQTLGKPSVGYHALFFAGEIAEKPGEVFRIGSVVTIRGSLWSRTYRDRKGAQVTEIKVVVAEIEKTA